MLIRSIPLAGAAGYVCRGPVCAEGYSNLAPLVVRELHTLARLRRVRYLAIQPPGDGDALAAELLGSGFWGSPFSMSQPTATVRMDLCKSHDALMAGMHSSTRRNVNKGLRSGIVVRRGTERDVSTFCRLLADTGRRQGFAPDDEEYISRLYRIFEPRGWLGLFLAEYNGEPVSAALTIAFGDTVYYKRGAWSGKHRELRPNEMMHWEMMRWAKAQGYSYYDFDGIKPECARAVLRGEPMPQELNRSVNSFKIGFGGRIVLLPSVYSYVYNPLLRKACRAIPAVSELRLVRWALR
jgi:lipid II:glycine glycyltransferase (peptidoglycan interpeptide bridge formation enzyme)